MQRLIAAVAAARAERLGLLLSRRVAAAGDGDDVDEAEPPNGIDVMRPHEAGADESHSDPSHDSSALTVPAAQMILVAHAAADTERDRRPAPCGRRLRVSANGRHSAAADGARPAPARRRRAGQGAPRRSGRRRRRRRRPTRASQIDAGRARFAAAVRLLPRPRCRRRRGRAGSDALALVAADVRGDRISPSSARAGRRRACRRSRCPTPTSPRSSPSSTIRRRRPTARTAAAARSTRPTCRPATPRPASAISTPRARAAIPRPAISRAWRHAFRA